MSSGLTAEQAAEQARERRRRMRETATELKSRIEGEVERVQDTGRKVTEAAVRYRWPLLGVALGVGWALGSAGYGRRNGVPRERGELAPGEEALVVLRHVPARRSSALGTALGWVGRRLISEAVAEGSRRLQAQLEAPPPEDS